jgi:hypothetical protein
VQHAQRRVQFGTPSSEMPTNQFKIADMMWKLKMVRLMTYYAAYCCDLGQDVPLEAAIAKMYAMDEGLDIAKEAIQIMGGDGATRFYPVERIMRDMKINQIAAGTSEILRIVIYRMGLRGMAADLKPYIRTVDERLKVPMPISKPVKKKKVAGEADVLKVLAEEYRTNPGLYMTMGDIKEFLDVTDDDLNKYLAGLEEKGLARLYRDKKGRLTMARVSYSGLDQANPPEHYRYFPQWIDSADIF